MAFLYFGYGSNMLTERLHERCKGAKPVGRAMLDGYALEFSKRSLLDDSGKATLREAPSERSFGVLFEIPENEQKALNKAEGGYDRKPIYVRRDDGQTVCAECYFGKRSDSKLKPYDWYLALIIAGADQHRLDELDDEYIERLRNFDYCDDQELERDGRKEAVKVLKRAGIEDYKKLLRR